MIDESNRWQTILASCGVASNTTQRWSTIFSEVITASTFSAGEKELPDFLGQILHESAMLERLEENLNYTTPGRLMKVWPSRFPSLASEVPYLRNPRALANKVYGSRLGNINGDGWTYRGSGLIMVTGLDNFHFVEKLTGYPVVSNPDLLRSPKPALQLALAWWEGKVPDYVLGDPEGVRRAVNGGVIGLSDTRRITNLARKALNA